MMKLLAKTAKPLCSAALILSLLAGCSGGQ